MPRKKSVKKSVERFNGDLSEIHDFLKQAEDAKPSKRFMTFAYELAIIKLYTAFERLMLDGLVGAINNETTVVSATTGVNLPRHLTDEVCEYLVVGWRYFNFSGRDGLIRLLKKYVPNEHYLVEAVKRRKYKTALERIVALRNFAAHESDVSKLRAKAAVGCNLGSAGSWLKRQRRFRAIADRIGELASEIGASAPF